MEWPAGTVTTEFRERIEELLGALREVGGFSVYCAMETEEWKMSKQAPGESMAMNFANIAARPIFLALVDKAGSDGRGVEIEHAYNNGSQVFLATGPDEELGWVMGELVALGRAEHIAYADPTQLALDLAAKVQ